MREAFERAKHIGPVSAEATAAAASGPVTATVHGPDALGHFHVRLSGATKSFLTLDEASAKAVVMALGAAVTRAGAFQR